MWRRNLRYPLIRPGKTGRICGTIIHMNRFLAIGLVFLFALTTFAGTRTDEVSSRPAAGATVGGIVTAVNGHLIHLADGRIVIDTTNAKTHGESAPIQPGMIVFATLTTADVAANAPLPASSISVTRLPDATLFGPVQSVDLAANTLTLLGRTIKVTSETSFGGMRKSHDGAKPGLADVLPNHMVQVMVDSTNGQLVATTVLLLAPAPPEVHATRGTVKTIGTDSWVIDRERGDDLTVQVNAQTKIVGSPKVGDTVDLLYRTDSANAFIAISIIKFEKPTPPSTDTFRFAGSVVSMTTQTWVVKKSEGAEQVTLKIESISKIEPGLAVGDNVDVLAQRREDGSVVALAIVKRRTSDKR